MIKSKKSLQAFAKWLFLFVIVLCFVQHLTRCSSGHAIWISRDQAVKNLENVLALLEQQHITRYRNQDWCKNIQYNKGSFSNNNEASTCNLFNEKALPIEGRAKADFDTLAQAIKQTGVNVILINVEYQHNSPKIKSAEFIMDVAFNRKYYTYEPNHTIIKVGGIPNELMFTPINKNWYQTDEDWN